MARETRERGERKVGDKFMTDNIKAFLETDALRTHGEWSAENDGVVTDCQNYNDGTSGWRKPGKSVAILNDGEYIENLNFDNDAAFIAAASRVAPDLAKMVDDMRVAKEALQGLHDDNMDYLTKNHLGGENNHWMKGAREVLTRLKPYEKLFEKEGER